MSKENTQELKNRLGNVVKKKFAIRKAEYDYIGAVKDFNSINQESGNDALYNCCVTVKVDNLLFNIDIGEDGEIEKVERITFDMFLDISKLVD